MSNQTAYKTGQNQSGIGKPHTGPLAFADAAAHIAANCPIVETWPDYLQYRIECLRCEARRVTESITDYRETGVQE